MLLVKTLFMQYGRECVQQIKRFLLQIYYYVLANRSFLKEVPFFCMVA